MASVHFEERGRDIMDFSFLKSTRFYALLIGAVSFYLKTKGVFGEAEMVLVSTIVAGFTVIKTVDRFGDKQVESSKIMSGIPPEEAVTKPPIN